MWGRLGAEKHSAKYGFRTYALCTRIGTRVGPMRATTPDETGQPSAPAIDLCMTEGGVVHVGSVGSRIKNITQKSGPILLVYTDRY